MGVLRSPHEATCPSIASRISLRGRNHVIPHNDIVRETCPPDRYGQPAGADRRPHRRGFRRRPAADSRRGQTPPRGRPRLGRGVLRALGHRHLPARPEACAGHGGVAAASPRRSRSARRRLRGLEGGQAAAGANCETADARRAGPHRLGHPRPAQDRPHRLPLADPALRRSRMRCSCSSHRPRWSRSASASTRLPSTSKTCSGAIAANSAPST